MHIAGKLVLDPIVLSGFFTSFHLQISIVNCKLILIKIIETYQESFINISILKH